MTSSVSRKLEKEYILEPMVALDEPLWQDVLQQLQALLRQAV